MVYLADWLAIAVIVCLFFYTFAEHTDWEDDE
jgi:hypothetical protein